MMKMKMKTNNNADSKTKTKSIFNIVAVGDWDCTW